MLLVQCRESGELVDLDSYYMTASEVERMIEEALDERLGESKDIDEDWCHAIAKSGKRCSRNSERDGLCRLHWRMRESGYKLKTVPTKAEIEERETRERVAAKVREARRRDQLAHEMRRQAVERDFEENGHAAREAIERYVDKRMAIAGEARDKLDARYDSLTEEEIREAILEHGTLKGTVHALGLVRRACHAGWLGQRDGRDRDTIRSAHCARFRRYVTKENGVWVFNEPEAGPRDRREWCLGDENKLGPWLKAHHPELRALVDTVRKEKAAARKLADQAAA